MYFYHMVDVEKPEVVEAAMEEEEDVMNLTVVEVMEGEEYRQ